jgi:hypothetical protein
VGPVAWVELEALVVPAALVAVDLFERTFLANCHQPSTSWFVFMTLKPNRTAFIDIAFDC